MNTTGSASQSDFVTVLAWVMIVLNGSGVLVALLQNIMVNLVMPTLIGTAQAHSAEAFSLTLFRVLALLFLCLSAFMTYAAYALLKRRNWARLTFIVVFVLSIAWIILSIAGFGLGFGLADFPTTGQGAVPREMRTMMNVMLVAFGIFALGMAVLCGWLIKRLRSSSVKAEFQRVT